MLVRQILLFIDTEDNGDIFIAGRGGNKHFLSPTFLSFFWNLINISLTITHCGL